MVRPTVEFSSPAVAFVMIAQLRNRRETEAATLADLTGWDLDEIHSKIGFAPTDLPRPTSCWKHLWQ